MATSIVRNTEIRGRTIVVKFTLVAKEITDDNLYRKFGDIMIDVTGDFSDPNDLSYPKFYVNAGAQVPFFTNQEIIAHFEDEKLIFQDLSRRARLWGDAIQQQIQNKLLVLRSLPDTISGTVTITI